MRRLVLATLVLTPSIAFAWPWSTDMMNQPSIKPQEGIMTPFPKHSVPVQGIVTKVKDRDEAKELKSPFQPTAEVLAQGRTLFRIYCSACHGLTGKADSPVSPKIGAISLVDDYVQNNLTIGWVYGTITFGSYVMPSYGVPSGRGDNRGANDLSHDERWYVANYVKFGLAKDAAEEDATTTASSETK